MFKTTLTAILLSSVTLVPAATIAVVASVDAAHAKSDNAGSNGGGGGKSSEKSSSGKSNSKAAKTTSGGGGKGKSTARSTGTDPVGNFFKKLTGQDKKTTAKAQAKSTRSAAPKVAKAAPALEKDLMHPSNLGKMNGAMNANVNALIAHVKNGNTNGPIGGMAALAVAGYAAKGAAETLAINKQFATLDQLLIDNEYVDENGNPDLEGYLSALQGTPGNTPIDDIENAADETALNDALLAAEFDTIGDYEAWRDGTAGAPPIEGAETLITDLDGQERPSDADIEYANEQIDGRTIAENYMLSIWNKGDGNDLVRSQEEEDLLIALYHRIEADGETLDAAIEEYADLPEPPTDEPIAEVSDTDEDVVAAAE